ncbi:MAG: hypothetical protein HKP41_21020 [Desulfobacterales bacterium]|nr:hypothetical protein [Desulfobacterales bacterium]
MFEDLVKTLEMHNYGVRAYEQVAQLCYKSVAEQPEYAVHFLVLSVFAERFVSRYDEYPLTVDEANREKKRILRWIEKMESSLKKSQEGQIELLNCVSRDFLYI